MKVILAAFLTFLATAAFAQQQPDPVLLQKVIGSMQAQRNQAQDAAAVAEARATMLSDDLAKANARIRELEPKPEAVK